MSCGLIWNNRLLVGMGVLRRKCNERNRASWIPQDVLDWLAYMGLDAALEFTADATAEYTPGRFYQLSFNKA